jgi:hypothetical protein
MSWRVDMSLRGKRVTLEMTSQMTSKTQTMCSFTVLEHPEWKLTRRELQSAHVAALNYGYLHEDHCPASSTESAAGLGPVEASGSTPARDAI